jgi:hypothetical protein
MKVGRDQETYEHAVRFDVIQRDACGFEESLERSNLVQPAQWKVSWFPLKQDIMLTLLRRLHQTSSASRVVRNQPCRETRGLQKSRQLETQIDRGKRYSRAPTFTPNFLARATVFIMISGEPA